MALTAAFIQKRLQIYNAAAAKKGYDYIVNYLEKGKEDNAILLEVELLVDLIDIILVYAKTVNGVEVVSGDTCLTEAQINNILNKLCQICDDPCTTYVNFN